jgi:hypothetical protein
MLRILVGLKMSDTQIDLYDKIPCPVAVHKEYAVHRFEVFLVMVVYFAVFWVVTPVVLWADTCILEEHAASNFGLLFHLTCL